MERIIIAQIVIIILLVAAIIWIYYTRKSATSSFDPNGNILGNAGIKGGLSTKMNPAEDMDIVGDTFFPSKNPYIRKTLPFILSKRNHNEPIGVTIEKEFDATIARPNMSSAGAKKAKLVQNIIDGLGTSDIEGSKHMQWLNQVRPFSKKRMEPDTLEPETFLKTSGLRLPQPIPYKNPILVNDSVTMEDLERNVNTTRVL